MARLRPTTPANPGHIALPTRLADPCVEDFLGPDGDPDKNWEREYGSARPYFDGVPQDELPYVVTAYVRWLAEHAAWVDENQKWWVIDGIDHCSVTVEDQYLSAFGLRPRWRSPAFMTARRRGRR